MSKSVSCYRLIIFLLRRNYHRLNRHQHLISCVGTFHYLNTYVFTFNMKLLSTSGGVATVANVASCREVYNGQQCLNTLF